jgi:hypothetical protein
MKHPVSRKWFVVNEGQKLPGSKHRIPIYLTTAISAADLPSRKTAISQADPVSP